jgi:hypothetical protein
MPSPGRVDASLEGPRGREWFPSSTSVQRTSRLGQSHCNPLLAAEIASEVLRTKERIAPLEGRLDEELVEAEPRGTVVRSLPGMGTVLSAQF